MSVEVAVFSPVEELLAVTVAPGISELPDFTTPEMEKVCAEGGVLRQQNSPQASSKNGNRVQTAITDVLE